MLIFVTTLVLGILQETIVHVLDIFENVDYTFIAMELMSGDSLMSRLCEQQDKILDEGSVRVIAYQLLLALEYLHINNIVHRDIKPANILMVSNHKRDNRVKLADFGLSTWVSGSMVAVTNCGTKCFKAPEVRLDDGQAYTSKVDIWSLGITILAW
jgi:serine/threonine protein kinase